MRVCRSVFRCKRLLTGLVGGLCLIFALTGQPRTVAGQLRNSARAEVESSGQELISAATQQRIDRGLAWLALRQNANGSFGSGSTYGQNVAVTSLSGMAFLSAGHTPGRGKYGGHVQKAVDYIVSQCRPNGYIINDRFKSHGPMYGHGFATLFLAEVYGMTPTPAVRDKLQKAVELIIKTQNTEGGWRYQPTREQKADISVTVCQMMALRAARNCGVSVPRETVDRCVEYVKSCQNPDGGYRYQLVRIAESEFPRSAAAAVALYNAGREDDPNLKRTLQYIMRRLPRGEIVVFQSHYYYGHYYAVQAMWHAGGNDWTTWYSAIRDELLNKQHTTGGWSDTSVCNEYSTAMSLLILQMPNNYLPIFQR